MEREDRIQCITPSPSLSPNHLPVPGKRSSCLPVKKDIMYSNRTPLSSYTNESFGSETSLQPSSPESSFASPAYSFTSPASSCSTLSSDDAGCYAVSTSSQAEQDSVNADPNMTVQQYVNVMSSLLSSIADDTTDSASPSTSKCQSQRLT
ncbi:hypothetical protein MUCCIDRAFT_114493 [Mucor lusitanicus CBS 277.49]|uniref:Uncharacterized protein n=1 Tax=Mucor lusitanicus CBS 277.49 TaxID=747725 RepID=A0A162Q632_MUCCL|nr:hypothetical protein MUCCIDRAFT_114493 [Mucor lusitanicus CBS 277.49]